MNTCSEQWNKVWKNQKYISDYMLRWYGYLGKISKALLPEKRDVLEVGSGSGAGIAIFGKDGHNAFGLDISGVAIERSSRDYKEVNFIKGDLFNMSFNNGSFDLVFNSGVIEHFQYPDNIKAVRSMARILKPKGRLIISVPNSYCLWYVLGKKILMKLNRWPYGYEDGYAPHLFRRYIGEVKDIELIRLIGMQALPMTATSDFSLLPMPLRAVIAKSECIMPFKEYYSYAIIAECIKK